MLQEASVRALKMSGGRFEAALEFLPKQQQTEPVNGISKGASSGNCINLLLINECVNSVEQSVFGEVIVSQLLKKLSGFCGICRYIALLQCLQEPASTCKIIYALTVIAAINNLL